MWRGVVEMEGKVIEERGKKGMVGLVLEGEYYEGERGVG